MWLYTELKRRNVLRVAVAYLAAGWLITEVSETIFPLFGFGDAPARIVVTLLAIGLPLFLIFSWVYELTPEGLKLEKDVRREESITPQTGKRIDRIIIVLLIVAVGYFAFDKFALEPARDAAMLRETAEQVRSENLLNSFGDRSIAVLPFIDLSPEGDHEYFSDGISEELLNLLSKIPELRVTSRSSSFSFKHKGLDIPTIAKQLNVVHVLEGSVRKTGSQLRITAQLIDARSDTQLWSQAYDRKLENIFSIQDEIAAAVVQQLKIALLGEVPRVVEVDPSAYSLYLQARHLARLNSAESFDQSNDLLEQVLEIEPDFAAAWSGLATNLMNQTINGLLPDHEGYSWTREAAEKALAIDPGHAEALATLGWVAYFYNSDLALATPYYEEALALDPTNTYIIRRATTLLQCLNRQDEAIALQEYANTLDPVVARGHANLAYYYLHAGRWDDAIASYQTTLRLSPNYIGAHYFIGVALLFKREAEAALDAFSREKDEEYRVKGTALAMYDLGRRTEFQNKLNELIRGWSDEWPSEIAHVYAYIGDNDAAFQWLDTSVSQNEEGLNEQFLLPFYNPIRTDPRWEQFLWRVGSSPEQLGAIEFKVVLPDPIRN